MKKDIKIFGFFLRPERPELLKLYRNLQKRFENFSSRWDVKVLLSSESAKENGWDGQDVMDVDELCEKSDILVSLGGDGTLLSTARKSFPFQKPILSIKAGNLGFLVDLDVRDTDFFLESVLNGDYKVEKRRVLSIERGEKRDFVLNDLIFTHSERMRMANIYVYTDYGKEKSYLLNNYHGDGLLISTATGSTAYNLSLGGPILFPEMSSFVLTPIAPHSLTQRSIILPPEVKISVGIEGSGGLLTLDGQYNQEVGEHERINISIHKDPIEIIRTDEYTFFKNLREKLKWGTEI
jgi:NAD+ kinase